METDSQLRPPNGRAAPLREAAEAYAGDLLQGPYQGWRFEPPSDLIAFVVARIEQDRNDEAGTEGGT